MIATSSIMLSCSSASSELTEDWEEPHKVVNWATSPQPIELTEEQKAFEKLSPEEQKEKLSKRVATIKVRCKNWPNCTDPTCTYSHPTETVSV